MSVELSGEDIRGLLSDLSEELAARGVTADLFLVGGAAMAVAYDARRSTRDVDAIFEPKQEVYAAAEAVGERRGIGRDWLNDAVKGFLHGSDPEARRAFEGEGLRVDVASPRYLLAMKLRAARPEDRDDIQLLYRECGFDRPEQGLALVERAYQETLPASVRFLVEELFGDDGSKPPPVDDEPRA